MKATHNLMYKLQQQLQHVTLCIEYASAVHLTTFGSCVVTHNHRISTQMPNPCRPATG
jgi:hypothetical protein